MTSSKFRKISVDTRSLYLQVTFHLLHRDSVGRESLSSDDKQSNQHQQNEQLPLVTDLKTLNTKTTYEIAMEINAVLGQEQNEAGFSQLMGSHPSPS